MPRHCIQTPMHHHLSVCPHRCRPWLTPVYHPAKSPFAIVWNWLVWRNLWRWRWVFTSGFVPEQFGNLWGRTHTRSLWIYRDFAIVYRCKWLEFILWWSGGSIRVISHRWWPCCVLWITSIYGSEGSLCFWTRIQWRHGVRIQFWCRRISIIGEFCTDFKPSNRCIDNTDDDDSRNKCRSYIEDS